MARCLRSLNELNELAIKILINKHLITISQISSIKLTQAYKELNFFQAIIEQNIIDNELVIDILHENYLLPILNNPLERIKILDYIKAGGIHKKGLLPLC
jgi:hypothetical protein